MQHIFFATKIIMEQDIHYTNTIHYELEQTVRLMRMLTLQLFEKLNIGVSFDECIVLDLISCNEGICQRDLAKMILKDRANTGRIINSLDKKGFIERVLDLKNNRLVKKIKINKKGLELLDSTTHKIRSYIDGVTMTVSKDEINRIRDTLRVFRLNLEKVVEVNI